MRCSRTCSGLVLIVAMGLLSPGLLRREEMCVLSPVTSIRRAPPGRHGGRRSSDALARHRPTLVTSRESRLPLPLGARPSSYPRAAPCSLPTTRTPAAWPQRVNLLHFRIEDCLGAILVCYCHCHEYLVHVLGMKSDPIRIQFSGYEKAFFYPRGYG